MKNNPPDTFLRPSAQHTLPEGNIRRVSRTVNKKKKQQQQQHQKNTKILHELRHIEKWISSAKTACNFFYNIFAGVGQANCYFGSRTYAHRVHIITNECVYYTFMLYMRIWSRAARKRCIISNENTCARLFSFSHMFCAGWMRARHHMGRPFDRPEAQ